MAYRRRFKSRRRRSFRGRGRKIRGYGVSRGGIRL